MKGHQYEQWEPLDRWGTLNMECDNKEKLKWNEYQLSRKPGPSEINIQERMWRLFTNVSIRSGKSISKGENTHKYGKIHRRSDL